MRPPERIPEVELSARIAQLHPLLARAEPHLEALCEVLDPGPYGLLLIDWDGIALWCRDRGNDRGEHGLGPGVDCAGLFGAEEGQRPALLAKAETFRLERGGVVHLGEPVTVAGRGLVGFLVLCEPKEIGPGHEGLLRLAARALSRLAAAKEPVPDSHERHARWLAAIMKQIPAALVVADARTGRIVMASKHAEDLFGGPMTSLGRLHDGEGSPFAPRTPEGRPLEMSEFPLLRAARTGEAVCGQELVLRVGPDRDARVVLSVAPVLEDGHPGALVITLEDVTARRAAEQERESILAAERQARESAEASGKVRERMVAALGHDLRQPLAAVMLALDALESEEKLDADLRSILRKTRRSAGRIEAMIRDLLDFSGAVAGLALQVVPQEADLRGIAESVVEELQVVDPKLQVNIRVAGSLRGSWDEGRLEQVLTNLLTNAARYGEPGSPVEVRLAGDDAEVSVEVCNRGESIPAEVQERLFQPFVRASRKGPGLGLGLFIVREIARAHGGSVSLRSCPAEGTVFTVNLPRRCKEG
ncbi:MAG TPA: ATP-binding protein [Myxococcales bacterium]|jgi:signal transduction histidine kinase